MLDAASSIGGGRYRVVALLGQGGMASVYRAWDERLLVWRAIKLLHPSFAPNTASRARFEQEARTMARLAHRNVLGVHDVGDEDGRIYLVMELAIGGSLADRLARIGPFPPRVAVGLVRDVLAGLAHAHEAGVVHRDVKPHNILLDAAGTPLVADFGIARVASAELTRTGATVGTLAYMAPEQRGGARAVDARADVYAAAGTLFALVTGREPHDLFVDGADTWEGVPDPLVPVLRRATRYDADERYADAAALAHALGDVLPQLPAGPADAVFLRIEADSLEPPSLSVTSATWNPATAAADPVAPPARRRWVAIAGVGLVVVLGALLAWRARPAVVPVLTERRLSRMDPAADPIVDVSLSPDGAVAWYATRDGLFRHPLDGEPARIPIDPPPGEVHAISADEAVITTEQGMARVHADGTVAPLPWRESAIPGPGGRAAIVDAQGLWVAPLDGGERAFVESSPGPFSIIGVAWSPDGTRLAVVHGGEVPVLEVLALGDGARHVVARGGELVSMGIPGVAWLGDGRLAWTSHRGGDGELWIEDVAADGSPRGEPVRAHAWPGALVSTISFGGGHLAVLGMVSNTDVWTASWSGGRLGAPTRLSSAANADFPAGWLGDGSVAWVGDSLRVLRPGAAEAEAWTSREDVTSASASSEGVLALRRADGGAVDAVWLTGPGEERRVRSVPPGVHVAVGCARQVCFLAEEGADGIEVRPVSADGTVGDVIARVPSPRTPAISQIWPDASGERLAFTAQDTSVTVWRQGAVESVQLGCFVQGVAWLPDGGAIVAAACHQDHEWMLARTSLATDAPLEPLRVSGGWISAPYLSADGQTLEFLEDPAARDVRVLDGLD